MVQCRECNSEVSDKAKFCPKCRTPLKSNEDVPKSPKIASDKKGGFNPILIIGIIAIVAIAALGAGLLLGGGSDDSPAAVNNTNSDSGVTNFFSPSGERMFYNPQEGIGIFQSSSGAFSGVLVPIKNEYQLFLTETGQKTLFMSQ